MALTLVRHTTPEVAKGTCYGRTDLALAESFETEQKDVLRRLPEATRVVSSPLWRCRQLAARAAAHVSGELTILPHWIEMDFGMWERTPWADIPRDGLDAWAADFLHYDGHGGESVAMLEARIRRALEATPDTSIVVTHSGCIRAACAIHGVYDGWDTDIPFGGAITLG